PALRRRLESLIRQPVRPAVTALVSIQVSAYRDYLALLTDISVEYVVGGDLELLQTFLSQMTLPVSDFFFWFNGVGYRLLRFC
ncbi:FMN reductase, partial [Salmonella enterica subsp. enterica serovar Typhimurium]|uniref:SIP domain-containing protein n=1 Tax=Salmonella enterica TaxID=28901 RepID=UPI0007916BFD